MAPPALPKGRRLLSAKLGLVALLLATAPGCDNFLVRGCKWLYQTMLRFAVGTRMAFVPYAVALLSGGLWLASRTGAEFAPRLFEMGIVINTVRLLDGTLESRSATAIAMSRVSSRKSRGAWSPRSSCRRDTTSSMAASSSSSNGLACGS